MFTMSRVNGQTPLDANTGNSAAPASTLADLLSDEPAKPRVVLRVLQRVLQNLAAVHAEGASHQPLAPETIHLDSSGNPQIPALNRPADAGDTVAFRFPKYSAPEVFEGGQSAACEAIDCYVAGFIFYEILIGRQAFATQFGSFKSGAAGPWLRWHADKTAKVRPLDELRPNLAHFADLIEKMIDKDLSKRIKTFADALAYFSDSEDQTTFVRTNPQRQLPLPAAAQTELTPKAPIAIPKSAIVSGIAAAVLIMAALVIWLLHKGSQTPLQNQPQVTAVPKPAPPLPIPELAPSEPAPAPPTPIAPESRIQVESRLNSPATISLDADTKGDIAANGLFEKQLSPGDHTVEVRSQNNQLLSFQFTLETDGHFVLNGTPKIPHLHSVVVDPDSAPGTLKIILQTSEQDSNIPVEISANVGDATVIVNGEKVPRSLAQGSAQFRFRPGTYRIKVVHAGYQDSPEQQLVVTADTQPTPLKFILSSAVRQAILAVSGGPFGAEVLVDGASLGTTDASGTVKANVDPGKHLVTFRKQNFENYAVTRDFPAGASVAVDLAAMHPLGEITFHVSPAGAQIVCRRPNESQSVVCPNNQPCSLPVGVYDISLKAAGFKGGEGHIVIGPGSNKPYSLQLQAETQPPLNPTDLFENGETWTVDKSGWWSHAQPGYSFMRAKHGTFIVDIAKPSGVFGSKKVTFVVNYRGEKSRVLYTIDEHGLHRSERAPGLEEAEFTVTPDVSSDGHYRLRMQLLPDRIVISDPAGKVSDTLPLSEPGVAKMGFAGKVTIKVSQSAGG